MDDLNDILSNNEEQLSNEELINYVNDELADDEKHAIETKLSSSAFMQDAADGLKSFKNKQRLNDYITDLNKNLDKQLKAKKQLKQKRKIKDLQWIILTAILILFICVISFMVIRLYNQRTHAMPAKTPSSVAQPNK